MGKVARADEVVGYNLRQGVSKKNLVVIASQYIKDLCQTRHNPVLYRKLYPK